MPQQLDVHGGKQPLEIALGANGGTITAVAGQTVYYRDEPFTAVADADGSIAVGESVTLFGTQYLYVDSPASTVPTPRSSILAVELPPTQGGSTGGNFTVIKRGSGPPTGDDTVGLYTDLVAGTRYWDGSPVAMVTDLTNLPDPLPPVLTLTPVISKTGSFDYTNELAGYRVEVDTTGGATVTFRSTTAAPIAAGSFSEIANIGTGVLLFASDSDVTVRPALPAGLPANSFTRVVYGALGVFSLGANVITLGAAPSNVIAPVISGTARTGSVVTAVAGGWTGNPTSYAYQWKRAGVNVGGATSSTYTVVIADETSSMTCAVTATNANGTGTAATSNALVAQAAAVSLPVYSVNPVVSGNAITGQTLTSTTGTASNNPTSYTYQWKRAGASIGAATSSTYQLVAADEGVAVKCTVTATNAAGSASADSNTVTPTAQAASGSLATLMITDMRSYASGTTFAGQGLANGGYTSTSASEAKPAGNWGGDWMFNPRAKSNTIRSGAARYIQPAGGVYEITGRNNTLCKVEVANVQGYVRCDDGTWIQLIHRTGVSGFSNLYPEDWGTAAPGNGAKSITVTQTASGTTTCLLGPSSGSNNQTTTNGLHYLFHFWAGLGDAQGSAMGGRAPSTISGVFAAVRMRLDPATYDATAKYIGYVGCDSYDGAKAWKSDLGIGRLKIVDANWRVYTMCTASSSGSLPTPTGASASEYR